jgi:hypothetical protein
VSERDAETVIRKVRRLADDLHLLRGPSRARVLAALEGLLAEARALSATDGGEPPR